MNMKVAIVYTAKSDELEKDLSNDAARLIGNDVEIVSYQDLSALKESVAEGYVSAAPAARYAGLILQAIADGADKVLSTCCFMGDIVRALQPFADYAGVPVASIDEGMCRHAALECEGVALLFTSPIAGASVARTLDREGRLLRRGVKVVPVQATEVAGLAGDALAARFAECEDEALTDADGLVLAQPSMAGAAERLRELTGKRVYCATDEPFAALVG